jgi:hypothetical protein
VKTLELGLLRPDGTIVMGTVIATGAFVCDETTLVSVLRGIIGGESAFLGTF